jgi:hypothetical protein
VRVLYREIVEWFVDDPACPFSVHQLATLGASRYGVPVGQWFGPSSIAHVLRHVACSMKLIKVTL